MEAVPQPPAPIDDQFDWSRFRDPTQAREHLLAIWNSGVTPDLLDLLRERLLEQFDQLDDLDTVVASLSRFIAASRDPTSLLSLFARDTESLPALLQVFATSQTLAKRLISDPESFDLLRASDGQPADRRFLVNELAGELSQMDQIGRAAVTIQRFYSREVMRVAYGEFVRGLSPEKVGRQLALVIEAILDAGLQFVLDRLAERRGMPQRPDGTTPELTVIGLGNLGGEEMGYSSPIKLVFLYDSIDNKNVWHRDFYSTVVSDLVSLLRSERAQGINIDLREGPRYEVGVNICSFREAIRIYETSGRTWQRLSFVKARVVAGSQPLGDAFLKRLQPWVYRQFMSRVELAEIRTLRRKLEKLAEQQSGSSQDVARAAGGRDDLELTVQFLQLLHGADLAAVRCPNTVRCNRRARTWRLPDPSRIDVAIGQLCTPVSSDAPTVCNV